MKRARGLMAAMGIVATIVLGFVNPNSALAADNYRAHLTGDEVVQPVETMATGQAIFRLSADGTELYYRLIVANITGVVQAHIHLAPAGVNGPVVAWLFGPIEPGLGRYNGVLAEGVITADDLVGPLNGNPLIELMTQIEDGNTYVNVHTADYLGGEIRGQIQ